jgi:biuret amidohydrolase
MALQLDRVRSALLLLDFQHDVVHPEGRLGPDDAAAGERFRAACDHAETALVAARRAELRVVHVATRFRSGYPALNPHQPMAAVLQHTGALLEGSLGATFLPVLAPTGSEATVVKRAVSAFAGTDLDAMLRAAGVETIVLAGVVTHFVVEGTAREAVDRGYRVVVLSDACASSGQQRHDASLDILSRIGELAATADLVDAVGGAPPSKRAAPEGKLAAVRLQARPVISRDEPTKPPTLVADQAEIIRVFKTFDADGNNFIDAEEFAHLCTALGGQYDEAQQKAAFDSVDIDGNGVVDFNEFMRWWLASIDAGV